MRSALVVLASLLALVFPTTAVGDAKPNYVYAVVGYQFYTGDVESRTRLDGAFSGEGAYVRHLHQNFAVRVGVSYVHDGHRDDDLRSYGATLSMLGVYPVGPAPGGPVRLYAGIGVGLYHVKFEGRVDAIPVDDADTLVGGHLLFGVTVDVWTSAFIGVEGKYPVLEEASFGGQELGLDGFAIAATLGLRF